MIKDTLRGLKLAFRDCGWWSLILILAVLDQATKVLVVEEFALHESREIIPGFFNLVYVQNLGAAFGIFSGLSSPVRELVLFSSTVLALTVVFAFMGSAVGESRLGRWGLALVCGGAFGNLVDRARLGYVIDFLDFYVGSFHWPAFNLADSYICIGVAILIFLPKQLTSAARETAES